MVRQSRVEVAGRCARARGSCGSPHSFQPPAVPSIRQYRRLVQLGRRGAAANQHLHKSLDHHPVGCGWVWRGGATGRIGPRPAQEPGFAPTANQPRAEPEPFDCRLSPRSASWRFTQYCAAGARSGSTPLAWIRPLTPASVGAFCELLRLTAH